MAELKGQLIVRNGMGLHARPCAQIVRLVNCFPGLNVRFRYGSEVADGHSVMELMILAVGQGAVLEVALEGNLDQCQTLLRDLQNLFVNKFGEE